MTCQKWGLIIIKTLKIISYQKKQFEVLSALSHEDVQGTAFIY